MCRWRAAAPATPACSAEVAENLARGVFLADHLRQGCVHVAVSASLAERGRAGYDDSACGVRPAGRHAEGRAHAVGRQLPGAGQFAGQASADRHGIGQHAPDDLFHDGLALFEDQQRARTRRRYGAPACGAAGTARFSAPGADIRRGSSPSGSCVRCRRRRCPAVCPDPPYRR